MSDLRPRVHEVIVVEGRYDRNTLSQVVDALIFETGGFSIFHNRAKLEALRMLAERRGLIILTDSDSAGLLIRGKLKGLLPPEKIRQAYIPAVEGKEKRKRKGSKEGLLGAEGMPPEILLEALRKAGVTEETEGRQVSTAEFYALGLTGRPGSQRLREQLAESLGLPAGISQSDLRRTVSFLLREEELKEVVSNLTTA